MAWQFSVGSLRGYSQPTEAVPPVTSSSLLQAGDEAFRRGAFEQAADAWQHSAQLAHEAGNLREECDAHVAVAQSYVVLGFHTRAAQQLELAVAIAQLVGDLSRQAVALNLLGQTYLTAGRPEPALETLENAQRLAAEAHDQVRMATILHSLGTTQAALKQDDEAVTSLKEARRLAQAAHLETLAATSTINLAKMALGANQWQEAQVLLDEALTQTRALPNSHDKAYGLISIGLGYAALRGHPPKGRLSPVLTAPRRIRLARDMLRPAIEAGQRAPGRPCKRAAPVPSRLLKRAPKWQGDVKMRRRNMARIAYNAPRPSTRARPKPNAQHAEKPSDRRFAFFGRPLYWLQFSHGPAR